MLIVGYLNCGVIYDCRVDGSLLASGASYGAIAGKISGEVTVVGCKNKTDVKDYPTEDGVHIHTASSHDGECACGEEISLACAENEYGYCKYCEIDITGASVTVGSEISINYFVKLADASLISGKTLSMEFTFNGKTVRVDSYTEKNGKLVFTLSGILAHEIGDLIDASLVLTSGADSEVIASKDGYSVKDNLVALLEITDSAQIRTLINSLIEYATKAQAYLDYNTDRFAGGGVNTVTPEFVADDEDKTEIIGNKNAKYNVIKVYADLDADLKLKVDLYLADISSLIITVNGEAYDNAKLISLGEGKYTLVIDGFTPWMINDEFDICIIYSGRQTARIKTSVVSHLVSMIDDKKQIAEEEANYRPVTKSVNELEYQLFYAVYRYALAAAGYYNSLTEVSK